MEFWKEFYKILVHFADFSLENTVVIAALLSSSSVKFREIPTNFFPWEKSLEMGEKVNFSCVETCNIVRN